MNKDTIVTIIAFTALIAVMIDIFGAALQIQTLPLWLLRFYYVPAFAYYLYATAKTDMERQKEIDRQQAEYFRKKRQQEFVEEYAKFVSEVHK
jgi:hypothetical protein